MSVTLEIKYYNTFLIKSSEVTHQVVGTGDGSDTTFTIAESSGSTIYAVPNSEADFQVYFDNVLVAATSYVYANKTRVITFTSAPSNGVSILVVVKNWHIEESRIRGAFNGKTVDFGVRAAITDNEYAPETREASLIYSGIYNGRTRTNEINQFNPAIPNTKSIDSSFGSIQKLFAEDNNLNVFQENKVHNILIDKDIIFTAEGDPQVTSSDQVLGQVVAYTGNYGISKNPESFAYHAGRKYFTDKNNGVVLRLSRDGITEISNFGMRDYFKTNLKLADSIVGIWDNNRKKYVLSLQENLVTNAFTGDGSDTTISLAFTIVDTNFATVNLPDPTNISQIEIFQTSRGTTALVANTDYTYNTSTGVVTMTSAPPVGDTITIHLRDFTSGFQTVTFDEDINGWSSFYGYKPAFGGSIDADFYTYGVNDLYKHYDLDANRGSFYGNSTIASTVDLIFNKPPSVSKYFQTINYEGNTGWSVNSIETDSDNGSPIPAYVSTSASAENTWQDLVVSGFKKKDNKYYSYIVNETLPKTNEILFGAEISGVKGFFNKVQLSVSDTSAKELFAVSSEYELLTN
ncbi:MAG: hypothetical protein CBE14_003205 [Rickettsiales bacterium TMED254]|nr:hypothetical protein [Candidatus Pelagibacter sp.]RPF75913.1 MAG: hypothetical protein CBE14_003205 [Rickettsiales bacterium TMED254]